MISTIEPAAVLPPPAPAFTSPLREQRMPDPVSALAPARTQGLQSLGSPRPPDPVDLPKLTERDEALLETILIPGHSLFSAAQEHKISLQALLDWWAQPHIKAALAAITDLGQARTLALAARHSASAVCWLQSAGTLTDCEFYENTDPKTRLRAFESARKAAGQLLRLAGLPTLGGRPLARPRPAPAGRGGRGSARPERGVPVSEPLPESNGSLGSAASRAQPSSNGSVSGHSNGHVPPHFEPRIRPSGH